MHGGRCLERTFRSGPARRSLTPRTRWLELVDRALHLGGSVSVGGQPQSGCGVSQPRPVQGAVQPLARAAVRVRDGYHHDQPAPVPGLGLSAEREHALRAEIEHVLRGGGEAPARLATMPLAADPAGRGTAGDCLSGRLLAESGAGQDVQQRRGPGRPAVGVDELAEHAEQGRAGARAAAPLRRGRLVEVG